MNTDFQVPTLSYHISCTDFRVLDFRIPIFGTDFRDQFSGRIFPDQFLGTNFRNWFSVTDFRLLIFSYWFSVTVFGYFLPATYLRMLIFGDRLSDTVLLVPIVRDQFLGTIFRHRFFDTVFSSATSGYCKWPTPRHWTTWPYTPLFDTILRIYAKIHLRYDEKMDNEVKNWRLRKDWSVW